MCTTDNFASLSRATKIVRLRRAAFEVLEGYELEVVGLRLIAFGRNTFFCVDTKGGRRFALRLNVNSRANPAHTRAEVAWIAALSRDTEVEVARPTMATRNGKTISLCNISGLARPRQAVLFTWLSGAYLQHSLNPNTIRQLGLLTKNLHRHASCWHLPTDASLPLANTVLLNSPPVLSERTALNSYQNGNELSLLLRFAWDRGESALNNLWSQHAATLHPLHFDLHPRNLKWQLNEGSGKLAVFDFDSSVIGHPFQDIATILHYLRLSPRWTPSWDRALRDGYESRVAQNCIDWPETEKLLEDLIAARMVLLVNELIQINNTETRKSLPNFFATILPRLSRWRQHGKMT